MLAGIRIEIAQIVDMLLILILKINGWYRHQDFEPWYQSSITMLTKSKQTDYIIFSETKPLSLFNFDHHWLQDNVIQLPVWLYILP